MPTILRRGGYVFIITKKRKKEKEKLVYEFNVIYQSLLAVVTKNRVLETK